jgi:hypothetical protein
MADRVDATPNPAQEPTPDPVLDRPAAHSHRQQLTPRDKPMLALPKVSHAPIKRT